MSSPSLTTNSSPDRLCFWSSVARTPGRRSCSTDDVTTRRPQHRQRRLPRRHHRVARAREIDGATATAFFVHDVGSLNGTYVNGEQVDETKLASGDEVQIGMFKLCSSRQGSELTMADAQLPIDRRGAGLGQDRVPRHHDLEDPVPGVRGPDRAGAHAVGLPQVLRGGRRPAEVDPADAARRVPPAQGHQGAAAQPGAERAVRRGRRRDRGPSDGAPTTASEELAEAPTGSADVDRGDVGGHRHRPRPDQGARVVRHRLLARARSARSTTTATTTSCCRS